MDVKEAVERARQFVQGVYTPAETPEVRLEEVEFDQFNNVWKVTLGWIETTTRNLGFMSPLTGPVPAPRVYKVFEVSNEDGTVVSMKIRDV